MVLALAMAAMLADASPYIRSRTSSDENAHCLTWTEPSVTFQQSLVGNPATGAKAFTAVSTAFATWEATMQQCGSLQLVEGARTAVRKVGVETTGANSNVVLFRNTSCSKKVPASNACWKDGTCGNLYDCWNHSDALLGITLLSYDTNTGMVLDADIELNGATNVFTTIDSPPCIDKVSQTCVAVDVQNTVTHEVGHLLGLEHTQYLRSTMNASASIGETSKRNLDTGTKSFVCDVYTKGFGAKDCVVEPADDTLGAAAAAKKGCSTSAGAPLLGAMLLLGLLRRRALVLGVLVSTVASATTVLSYDVEALTQQSAKVVRARVARVQPRWSADRSRIVTDIELAVTQTWKGAAESIVVLTQPGGEIGGVGQQISGAATLASGEEVVVFLEAQGPGYTLTAFSQGKFRVVKTVAQQAGAELDRVDPQTFRRVDSAPLVIAIDLLERRVRAASSVEVAPAGTVLLTK